MPRRANYEKELQDIFDKLVIMCRTIESAIEKCVTALVERKFELAADVYEEDKVIDRLEREIEQACLRLFVMEQPMASDFREVSAALKMITDLERIGDQSCDIMDIATQFKDDKYASNLDNIRQMAIIVIQMVKDGVQSYINRDLELAKSVDETDDKVDELFQKATDELVVQMKQEPDSAKQCVRLLMIAKYFERIGDHAVNVGEWVEYAITGNHPKNVNL
ncbi:MAG: phosphate signaling complex protein PhoU [Defluviitaleaceae bacterium]|nr:phosphate signaling complex protein PhoU [Defluviitaleaceae bacterium]MCL2261793.1 phosphate signaling complex protein PhoU [Defluviitaleaceae bacterium]